MDKNFIGERISELRLKKNVSEYQMSLDLGKNKSYIQSLTSGRSRGYACAHFHAESSGSKTQIDFRGCQIKAAFIFIIFS